MRNFKFILFLASLLSLALSYAQENCSELESIHILHDTSKINVINNEACPNNELYIAIPKDEIPKRFNISRSNKANSFYLELRDVKKVIRGSVFNRDNVIYGGNFKIGEKLRVNGIVLNQRVNRVLDINHNHEFAIFKLDLNHLTLEPTFHQYARFHNMALPNARVTETIVQPAAFGVFVRKQKTNGREFSFGVTGGPSMQFYTTPVGNDFQFKGQVNLRLTIPL